MKRFALALGLLLGLQAHGAYAARLIHSRDAHPLATLLSDVRQIAAKHEHPVVLFDLDDTLFTTQYRNLAIVKEWAATLAGAPYRKKLMALTADRIGYDNDPVLLNAGVPASQLPAFERFWAQRFFTSAYLVNDRAEPGAVAYVRALEKAGARIVYLTGRPAPMLPGTQQALIRCGFPWDAAGAATELIVKKKQEPDAQFKFEQAQALAISNDVIASFDNEPANVNAFHRALPQGMVVYIETIHSAHAPAVEAGIEKVRSFPAN
ncbi:MAG TPA: HAD family hydrolase [Oscillatoriaceae cyanobacterium]